MKKFLSIFALLLLCCSCTSNKKVDTTRLYTYTIHTIGGVQDTIECVGELDKFLSAGGNSVVRTTLVTYYYVDKIEIIDIKTVK